jgi:chromate transporter
MKEDFIVAKELESIEKKRGLSLAQIALTFIRIGAVAFGGLGSTIALIESELIERRGALSKEEVTEAMTYTKFLPGSTGPQVVAYLGYKLGGWPGSALAVVTFLLPAIVIMLLFAIGYVTVATIPVVKPAIGGLVASVIGILIATTYRFAKSSVKGWPTGLIALLAFVIAFIASRISIGTAVSLGERIAKVVLQISSALIVVTSGIVGILLFRKNFSKPAAGTKEKEAGK